MKSKVNRIMIVGTGSGCGKTTVTMGLLKALRNSGMTVSSFKCGPDYIDPMFHSEIIGAKSRNLDLYLCGGNTVRYLLSRGAEGTDFSVIEGVMGMYDGLGFDGDDFSANHISRETGTPQILVVNVRGKSVSLLAELSGYLNFRENRIKGIVLNGCSKAMYPSFRKMIEDALSVAVLGFLPPVKEAEIGSRHLGLVTAEEVEDLKRKTDVLGQAAAECLDLEGIIRIGQSAPELDFDRISISSVCSTPVKIGVARDRAFCFYYEDNFRLLADLGAEPVFFSPLADSGLPEGISGLILGGGYPEEHLAQLSENRSMADSIKKAVQSGMPVYAECGGFMYLGETIEREGRVYPVAGAIRGHSHMTAGLVRFGYKELTANRDNLMCKAGEKIRCHEFHYSDTDCYGDGFTAEKRGRNYQTIVADDTVFAGYPHLHLWSNIRFAENYVRKCSAYGGKTWK